MTLLYCYILFEGSAVAIGTTARAHGMALPKWLTAHAKLVYAARHSLRAV